MYIIAHVTDKADTPAIRRQLRKAGFRYQPEMSDIIDAAVAEAAKKRSA